MGLMDFIKKQFIDVIEWTESGEGLLAYRFPMADNEIQYGASLTVRESQIAVFVNEGKVADVFGPGRYKLETNTLPVLTYLKNWDKLFESPFKSDVYFFSTRIQTGRKWGTPQPITKAAPRICAQLISIPKGRWISIQGMLVSIQWITKGSVTIISPDTQPSSAAPMVMTIPEFTQYLREDIEKWARIVKISGAKADQ